MSAPAKLTATIARGLYWLSFGPVRLPSRLVSKATQRSMVERGLAEDAADVGCPNGLRLTRAGRAALAEAQS